MKVRLMNILYTISMVNWITIKLSTLECQSNKHMQDASILPQPA